MRARDLAMAVVVALALGTARRARGAEAAVVLRWDAVPSASSYQIQIASDAMFEKIVVDEMTESPKFVWRELPSHEYFWRLRCRFAFERTGRWSDAQTIVTAVEPPIPTEPADGAILVSGTGAAAVVLGYRRTNTIARERIEISSDQGFTRIVATADGLAGSAIVAIPDPGTYYWRVRSDDVLGRPLPPSVSRELTVSRAPPPIPRERVVARAPARETAARVAAPPVIGTNVKPPPASPGVAVETGLALGWLINGSSSTPWLGLDVSLLPSSKPDFAIRIRGGYLERSLRFAAAAPWGMQSSRARVIPISVQFTGRRRFARGVDLYGGGGPILNLMDVRVGQEERLIALPGAGAVCGVSISTRRGTGFAELEGIIGRLNRENARLDAGGILVVAGVRFGRRP